MIPAIVIAVAVVALVVVLVAMSRRGPVDGVESFQRQIDALSPQARRRVVDRVQQIDEAETETEAEGDGAGRDPDVNGGTRGA